MKFKLTFGACFLVLMVAGCAPGDHFGVTNTALTAPPEFEQTEAAIAKAEQSEGARYCPEKIAQARALYEEAVELFWACPTGGEVMGLLARARQLANEAESCQPPKVTPPPPSPLPTTLPSSYFDLDESTLLPEAQAKLDGVAVFMKDNPHVNVVIEGHTDAIGTEDYNMALGQRRAQAAEDYLEAKGISSSRISTVSYGETRPIASNATREGRAQNRRVDLIPMK